MSVANAVSISLLTSAIDSLYMVFFHCFVIFRSYNSFVCVSNVFLIKILALNWFQNFSFSIKKKIERMETTHTLDISYVEDPGELILEQ